MARTVDRSTPLTRRDYVYLRNNERLPRKLHVYKDEPWTDVEKQALKNLGASFVEGGSGESSAPDDDEPEDEYDDMTVDDLKEELDERSIDYSRTDLKNDLIELLREDDRE